jgi:hypothetical protein
MMLLGQIHGETIVLDERVGLIEELVNEVLHRGQGYDDTYWRMIQEPRSTRYTLDTLISHYVQQPLTSKEVQQLSLIIRRRARAERQWILAEFARGVLGMFGHNRRRSDGRPTLRGWRRLRDQVYHRRIQEEREIAQHGHVLGPDESPF